MPVQIKVNDNGPLLVKGEFELLDGDGNKMETKESTYLCRCGLSINKPFCNSAHKSKFESVVRANAYDRNVKNPEPQLRVFVLENLNDNQSLLKFTVECQL